MQGEGGERCRAEGVSGAWLFALGRPVLVTDVGTRRMSEHSKSFKPLTMLATVVCKGGPSAFFLQEMARVRAWLADNSAE